MKAKKEGNSVHLDVAGVQSGSSSKMERSTDENIIYGLEDIPPWFTIATSTLQVRKYILEIFLCVCGFYGAPIYSGLVRQVSRLILSASVRGYIIVSPMKF